MWRAFAQAGLNLDYTDAPLRLDLPPSLAALVGQQVRADDLYASAFGPFAATSVVQDNHSSPDRLLIILSHYELAMACIGSCLHGDGLWLALALALALAGAAAARLRSRRRAATTVRRHSRSRQCSDRRRCGRAVPGGS